MIKHGLQLLAFITMAIGIYYGVISIYKKTTTHSRILLNCPSTIHPKTINEITQFCEQKATLNNTSWLKELEEQYPVISHIQLKKDNRDTLTISINAHTCKALINNSICISEHGAQYPLEQFNPSSIKIVPQITLEQSEDSKPFNTFLKEVTPEILEQYEIIWHSPYKIYLKPKNKKHCLLIRANNIPNETSLKVIHYISNKETLKKNMILDTRFNNQIVVFANRGEKDGKGIFR